MSIDPLYINFDLQEYQPAYQNDEINASEALLKTEKAPPKEISSFNSAIKKQRLYVEDYQISKPTLEYPDDKPSVSLSHVEIIIKLMNHSEKLVHEDERFSFLKVQATGKRLEFNKTQINDLTKKHLDIEKANQDWDFRKALASNILYVITTAAGAGLLASGEPISGSSLLISGLGGLTSSVMDYFRFNKSIVQSVSGISSLVGVFGTIGAAFYNPQAFQNTVSTMQLASGLIANLFAGYGNYAQSQNQSLIAHYDSLHSQKENERRLLDEKMTSAITSHKSTIHPLSTILKGLTKAQKKMNTTAEMLVRRQFV